VQENKNKETIKYRDKKEENIFTLVTKRIKRAHTVISGDIKRVKSRRINYAKIISIEIRVCKEKKQRSSVFRER
jgi:hypothetical protein